MKRGLSLIVLTSSLLISLASAKQSVCHALAMSGGANKGAYEAGVVYGLAHLLDPTDVSYDVVTGVSAGALNAAGMSLWAPNETKAMSEWILTVWRNLTNDQIYESWPLGFVQGLFAESGVYNDAPLLSLVQKIFSQFEEFKKKIVVSAVDVNTGKYVAFTDEDTSYTDYPLSVVSSASIPFVFPHRHIGDYILMDGGTVYNTNLVGAVERCMELVDDQSQIVMDIVLCHNGQLAPENNTSNSIGNYLRYWDLSGFNKGIRDVLEFQRAYPRVQYRYFFMPSKPLASGLQLLSFTQDVIEPMIQIGIQDAQTMVNQGKGKSFERLQQWNELVEKEGVRLNPAEFIHKL